MLVLNNAVRYLRLYLNQKEKLNKIYQGALSQIKNKYIFLSVNKLLFADFYFPNKVFSSNPKCKCR